MKIQRGRISEAWMIEGSVEDSATGNRVRAVLPKNAITR
jgi:hypothetical protein